MRVQQLQTHAIPTNLKKFMHNANRSYNPIRQRAECTMELPILVNATHIVQRENTNTNTNGDL